MTQTVPITSALFEYIKNGELASMNEDDVEPFLKERLKWRVQAVDGRVIDPRTLSESHSFQLGISVRISPLRDQTVTPHGERFPKIIEDIIAKAS